MASDIWMYFTRNSNNQAICKNILCASKYDMKSSTTPSLWYHTEHSKKNCRETTMSGIEGEEMKPKRRNFLNIFKKPIGYYLSKIVAEDNTSINTAL